VKRGLACLLVGLVLGCTTAPPPEAREVYTGGPELDLDGLDRLARDFYSRLENRRFNSLATFQDPGLREFFRTTQSHSDYYAELAFVLELTAFEASRPTRVRILSTERESANRVRMYVLFTGENGLPLRWWEIDMLREDIWETDASGRWWIVPGKV
jgi:hypothetical protein